MTTVLDKAERDGAVEIRHRDGTVFRILPSTKIQSIAAGGERRKGESVQADDLVAIVRKGQGTRIDCD